jgi:hypothetical protein
MGVFHGMADFCDCSRYCRLRGSQIHTIKSAPRFCQQLARAQLTSFYAFKNKYPNISPQDLYSMVLTTRPGYDAERASNIIAGAVEVSKEMGEDLRFWMVVLQLAAYEYLSRTGQSPMPVMNDLRSGVIKVIPEHL